MKSNIELVDDVTPPSGGQRYGVTNSCNGFFLFFNITFCFLTRLNYSKSPVFNLTYKVYFTIVCNKDSILYRPY